MIRNGRRDRRKRRRPSIRPFLLLGGLAAVVWFWGTPHVGFNYQCMSGKKPGGGCYSYHWCEYYGLQGRQIVRPQGDEACHIVKLVPVQWERLFS